ncbi:sensor histidine kinase [Bradyrhizobium sp.]|jgi:PAS domain S-box-containing protein|uniref:sensor histidine kinase n=1 Tax=Bradyrhizobium sp. TaxID=376 RepID=UPI003C1C4591
MYSPHGICLLWEPELIWLHVVSDAMTAIAYFSIPFALGTFISKRRDVQFGFIAWAFVVFILACGLTHVLAIYTLWVPVYGIEGLVKALTAAASLVTATTLWFLFPKLLAIPNPNQVRQGEERFRLVVESAPNAMAMVDRHGAIVLVNRQTEKLFGYDRSELLGTPVERLMPERYRRRHPDLRKGAFIAPSALISEESAMGPGRELHGLRKDGSEFTVEIGLTPIQTDAGIMMLSAIVDVTERKLAEQQSEASARLAREQAALIEQTYDPVLVWNWNGPITFWNKSAENLYGFSRAEAVGRTSHDLLRTRLPDGGEDSLLALLQTTSSWEGELEHFNRDGKLIVVDSRMTLVRDGARAYVIEVNRDAFERRKAQDLLREANVNLESRVSLRTAELQAANADVEDFAYAASHDLKAPLRVIDNAAKWLEEDLEEHLTGENRENMTMLRSRVWRMEKLLDDLLEYSRIGRITGSQGFESIAGNELMDNILALIAPPAGFAVQVSPKFAEAHFHRMPLQQIFMNLIGNAIKHHDKSEGNIEVTLEDCGVHYVFAVRDDGPGIPAQFHSQIFKLFETLKPRDQVEGSGMGLAIVRKNIESSGGKLDLESSAGNGSIFRFTWPKVQIVDEAA